MLHTLLNVFYVLIAIAMIALILLQRGPGAQAGSGFGAGASGTVFGARGSANFLSSSTKWLAALFFGLSLFMAWQASHQARAGGTAAPSIMSELPADAQKPVAPTPLAPAPLTPATPVIAPAVTTPAGSAPATESGNGNPPAGDASKGSSAPAPAPASGGKGN